MRGRAESASEPLRSELTVRLGPVVKWSNTPLELNRDTYIGSLEDPPYGMGSFGQVGLRGEIGWDTRDNPAYSTRGLLVRATASATPDCGMWSRFRRCGRRSPHVPDSVHPVQPDPGPAGGRQAGVGDYPFHESAFLGGPGRIGIGETDHPLRGFYKNRFAGDAVLYGNAELRLALADIRILVPGRFGLFGAADVGRVFYSV